MTRYSVRRLPGSDAYVIHDAVIDGFCSLPDDADDPHPNMLPLEWGSSRAAQAWLSQCYAAWERGTVPAPDGWDTRTSALTESRA